MFLRMILTLIEIEKLSELLGDVILDSDWLPTTLGESQQQCIKIDQS